MTVSVDLCNTNPGVQISSGKRWHSVHSHTKPHEIGQLHCYGEHKWEGKDQLNYNFKSWEVCGVSVTKQSSSSVENPVSLWHCHNVEWHNTCIVMFARVLLLKGPNFRLRSYWRTLTGVFEVTNWTYCLEKKAKIKCVLPSRVKRSTFQKTNWRFSLTVFNVTYTF